MTVKERKGTAETPLARYELYQKSFNVLVLVNLLMMLAVVLSIIMAWSAWTSKPEPRYFATREDGGIIPLVAISQPFLKKGEVTNFAVEAITAAFTMDYKNWRKDLDDASIYFQRPEGWDNFLNAIQTSGTLDFIRNRKLISDAVANGASILSQGIDENGRYSWTVQIPLKISFESQNQRSSESMTAEVIVSRLPVWESSAAVGITRITMKLEQRR